MSELPELYQPISGHPEFDNLSARGSRDRLRCIENLYLKLSDVRGRQLKVLDLGSAQGFFSLELAKLGAETTGIDFLDANVRISNFLARENSLNASFIKSNLRDYLRQNELGGFDMVLGLSVWHHVAQQFGQDEAKKLLLKIHEQVDFVISELALREEGLEWSNQLSLDPLLIFPADAYIEELGWFPTHLTERNRPILFSSRNTALFNQRPVYIWKSQTSSNPARPDARGHSRAFLHGSEVFIKQFRFSTSSATETFKQELLAHDQFASAIPQFIPTLLEAKEGQLVGHLVMENIDGISLFDALEKNSISSVSGRMELLESVLEILSSCEKKCLFHNDLRPWNVLITKENQPILIDFEGSGREPDDSLLQGGYILALCGLTAELLDWAFLGAGVSRLFSRIGLKLAFLLENSRPEDFSMNLLQLIREQTQSNEKGEQIGILVSRSLNSIEEEQNLLRHKLSAMEQDRDRLVIEFEAMEQDRDRLVMELEAIQLVVNKSLPARVQARLTSFRSRFKALRAKVNRNHQSDC